MSIDNNPRRIKFAMRLSKTAETPAKRQAICAIQHPFSLVWDFARSRRWLFSAMGSDTDRAVIVHIPIGTSARRGTRYSLNRLYRKRRCDLSEIWQSLNLVSLENFIDQFVHYREWTVILIEHVILYEKAGADASLKLVWTYSTLI